MILTFFEVLVLIMSFIFAVWSIIVFSKAHPYAAYLLEAQESGRTMTMSSAILRACGMLFVGPMALLLGSFITKRATFRTFLALLIVFVVFGFFSPDRVGDLTTLPLAFVGAATLVSTYGAIRMAIFEIRCAWDLKKEGQKVGRRSCG